MIHPRSLLLALLLATAAAVAADAQVRPLTRTEITSAGAADLHELVARLRPEWLALGGAPDSPWAQERVLVFIDGRLVGDLRQLRDIPVDGVAGIRVHTPEYVKSRYPRYPRTDFVAALYVSTETSRGAAVRATRRLVRLYAVAPVLGQGVTVDAALSKQGFDRREWFLGHEILTFTNPGYTFVPGVGIGASTPLRGAVGAEVLAEHVFSGWVGRVNGSREALSADFSWTDVAFLATLRQWPGVVAAGPMVRRVDWTWAGGFCGCIQPESSTSHGYGAKVNFSGVLPVRQNAALEVRVGVSQVLSHSLPAYEVEYESRMGGRSALDLSGTELHLTLGLAVSP